MQKIKLPEYACSTIRTTIPIKPFEHARFLPSTISTPCDIWNKKRSVMFATAQKNKIKYSLTLPTQRRNDWTTCYPNVAKSIPKPRPSTDCNFLRLKKIFSFIFQIIKKSKNKHTMLIQLELQQFQCLFRRAFLSNLLRQFASNRRSRQTFWKEKKTFLYFRHFQK